MGNRHIKHVNQRADFKRLPHVRIELYTVSDDEGNVWRRGRWRHWYVNPLPGSYAYGRRHDKTLKKRRLRIERLKPLQRRCSAAKTVELIHRCAPLLFLRPYDSKPRHNVEKRKFSTCRISRASCDTEEVFQAFFDAAQKGELGPEQMSEIAARFDQEFVGPTL